MQVGACLKMVRIFNGHKIQTNYVTDIRFPQLICTKKTIQTWYRWLCHAFLDKKSISFMFFIPNHRVNRYNYKNKQKKNMAWIIASITSAAVVLLKEFNEATPYFKRLNWLLFKMLWILYLTTNRQT